MTQPEFETVEPPERRAPDVEALGESDVALSEGAEGRRRFTKVSVWAAGLVTVPYLWILWCLWGTPDVLRHTQYENNFYDLQTRAMFHGRLSIPQGSIGIEGFFHAGREYTYFGIFPSIIRMPILWLTPRFDGKLAAPSMGIAWLITAMVVPLLLWRIRVLVRGSARLGRAEAVAYGFLVASCLGGTVLMQLASNPFVFSEDLAWSVCLALVGFFVLLGILQRPTRQQIWLALVVILAANLNRVTTGWALTGAAVLIAGYFAFGLGGPDKKKWALRVLAVGLVPFAAACIVNYAKFGVPVGVSNFAQEWTRVNAYRRQFLAANHNSESGTIFIPTAVLTYLRPDGVHLSSIFPFVTLPLAPPTALGGVLFDRLYRTASIPASMPLAFLLGLWGLVTAFRPRSVGQVHLMRIVLLASAGSGALLFGWGYIADRYLADFLPFFVLAAAVGMADIWRRMEGRGVRARRAVLVGIAVLAGFSVVANIGIAVTPSEEWTSTQALHFVQAQQSIGSATGMSLKRSVHRVETLPPWAPAGQLAVVGDCSGLYVSTGERYATVPAQQYARTTWVTVERGSPFAHNFSVRFSAASEATYQELVSSGSDAISVSSRPSSINGKVSVLFVVTRAHGSMTSVQVPVAIGSTHAVEVVTDTAKHLEQVTMDGVLFIDNPLTNYGPIENHVPEGVTVMPEGPLTVTHVPLFGSDSAICRKLIG